MELLEHQLATARTADDYIDLMAQNLQETVHDDPDFVTLVFELFTLSRRNSDIAAEYAGLMRRTREQVAAMLAGAQREGILHLHAEPEAIAEILFSLGTASPCACSQSPTATSPPPSGRHRRDAPCYDAHRLAARTCRSTSTAGPTARPSRSSSPSAKRR